MFDNHNHNHNYYKSKRRFTHKKKPSYYSKSNSLKVKSSKRKNSLVEIDDNYYYQTILPKEEVTEISHFQLEEEEKESNKENISLYANQEESTAQCSCSENKEIEKKENSHSSENLTPENSHSEPTSPPPCINLSNESLQEAYYFPKKLTNMYKYIYSQYQMQYKLLNSSPLNGVYQNQIESNPLKRTNSNIVCTNQCSISPFMFYDPPFQQVGNMKQLKKPISQTTINLKNVFIGNTYFEKESEREKENTDILSINIKISKTDTLVFKIRRYDDMFKTVKIFCEINQLDSKYIKPLIIYIIRALNGIYGIYNMKLTEEEITFLKELKEVV